MVSNGDHGGGLEQEGGPLRLLGHLKANRRVAYVLLVMVMVHLSNQYDRYLFSVSKIPFVDYDSFEFALIAGPFFTAVNSLAGVLLSLVGDVRPVRLLSTACLFWSASTGAVAFSKKFWQVALARVGQGIGDAACSPFAASILRDHFGPEVIGSAIGIYYVGLYAGFSLALGAGTLVDDLLGWKWAYLLAALAGALTAAVTFLTVPEPLPLSLRLLQRPASTTSTTTPATTMVGSEEAPTMPWGNGPGYSGGSLARLNPSPARYSMVNREEREGGGGEAPSGHSAEQPVLFREHGPSRSLPNGDRNDEEEEEGPRGADGRGARRGAGASPRRGAAPSLGTGVHPNGGRKQPPPEGIEGGLQSRSLSSRALLPRANPHPYHAAAAADQPRPPRGKLSELSAAWLTSPSLLLVCVAGGVRDAGGFVFGYYLASYFSPLLDGNAALTRHGAEPCSLSFNTEFMGDQVCNDAFPWCVDGLCNRLTGSPWHDVGMSPSQLEWFVSWVPLVGGSLGAMMGGFLSDRVAQRLGTAGRLWVVVVSNALASPFAVGVLLAPYPWCFVCLLGVELLGEMWIGVVLAVVMALVPRRVRVTSVALYSFIITNISGLSTTLVPLLRSRYDSLHTFRFLAEPLAGTVAAAAAVSSLAGASGPSAAESGGSGDSTVFVPLPLSGVLGDMAAVVRLDGGGRGGEGDEGLVEYHVSGTGSGGLRAAMLWMYPGMYVASSFFCLAAILALGRDRRGKAAAAAADEAAGPGIANGALCTERDGQLSPTTGRWEVYGSAEEKESSLRASAGGMGMGGREHSGIAAEEAADDPLLRAAGYGSDSESVDAHV